MRKKTIFAVIVVWGLFSVFLVSSFAWAQNSATATYAHGWQARIFSVTQDFNIIGSLPSSELANFVATKSRYRLTEYMNIAKGSPPINYPLWKGEGFLKTEESGYYVFSIVKNNEDTDKSAKSICTWDARVSSGRSWISNYDLQRTNFGMAIYVGDVVIASGVNPDYLMGATILEPGLHKIEFRIFGGTGKNGDYGCFTSFNALIKRPSDNRGVPISEIMLLPVPVAQKK